MPVRLSLGGAVTAAVTPHEPGEGFALGIGERGASMRLQEFVENDVRFTCNGLGRKAVFHRDGTVLDSHCLGRPWHIEDLTRKAVPRHVHAGSDGKLRASMNGRVVAVLAAVGAAVEAGRAMVTLEAMKMEHIHTAPVFGHVKVLHVGRPPTPRSGSALARGEPTFGLTR